MIKLSILIPATTDRANLLSILVYELTRQINELGAQELVEIKTSVDSYSMTTGSKRNLLINSAVGEYEAMIDCDDKISPNYIREILKGAETGCDCMAMSGIMTTDGGQSTPWDISMHNEYKANYKPDGSVANYERFINHLSPIKRSIAIQIPFDDISYGEDYNFACKLRDSGLLKTEYRIPELEMYHYVYSTAPKRMAQPNK